jgi:MFS family permease
LWGGIAGLAVAAGPIIGGAVVEGLNWHWIFWLNVPIGLVLIPLSATRLRESFGPRQRLDVVGMILAGGGLFAITWGLVRSSAVGWASAEVIGALVGGASVIGLFLWWEHRTRDPMLPLALFRRSRFSSANAVSFFMYASLLGAAFLMSQFFQTAQHHSPVQTGLRLLPWTAAPMIVSPIAGKLAERYGNRPFMTIGMLLQGSGLACVAAIATAHLAFGELGVALGVAGVGIALVFPTVSTEVLASVGDQEVGIASGANSALREVGGVFGVAVLASVFARPGAYAFPTVFVHGFTAALWVGAAFSAAGALAAVLGGVQRRPHDLAALALIPAEPAFAEIHD